MGEGRSIWADCFYGLAVLLWVIGGVQCLLYFNGDYSILLDNSVELVLYRIDRGIELLAALLVHVLGFLSFFAARSVDPKAGLGEDRKAAISAF